MILVDDGSDNILSKFIEINDYDFKLKIIRSNFNKGQSASIKIALENVEDSSNLIGLIDGDGQNNPRDIDKILQIYFSDQKIKLVGGIRKVRKDPPMMKH